MQMEKDSLAAASGEVFSGLLSFDQFEQTLCADIAALVPDSVQGFLSLFLSWRQGPWVDTGWSVQEGEEFTLLLNGKAWLSRTYNLSYPAALATWLRIGEQGPIFRSGQDSLSFRAQHSGRLYAKLYPRERWLDRSGAYLGDPPPVNPDEGGGVNLALLRWAPGVSARQGLARILERNPESRWAQAEQQRIRDPGPGLPAGWQDLWELAPSRMFTEVAPEKAPLAPARAIRVQMHDEVAILQKAANFALRPGTTLQWAWRIDALPSLVAENSLPTHDYLSVAVEFDNGRDLSYFWSRDLPVGTHFHCPLPGWSHRETHLVARKGTEQLGQWLQESRDVYADYAEAIGGPAPQRIVRIWLIGVSLFQHGKGSGEFGAFSLACGQERLELG
ncbi:Protein of unknown function [Solimonas aquatica]|uniref:DUF3047 domain-containing protein n=1 Tax=Solimonas aquatica TaxID=489703 RepID=A0A1H9A2B0_9GAMM|nr:DUF3047 domain-containing protein [Solimonas aquatica]SEP70810.1 Protein of unknown function [Solimonas aquatica]